MKVNKEMSKKLSPLGSDLIDQPAGSSRLGSPNPNFAQLELPTMPTPQIGAPNDGDNPAAVQFGFALGQDVRAFDQSSPMSEDSPGKPGC